MLTFPQAWELGEELTTPHCKMTPCYKTLYRAGFSVDSCEQSNEPLDTIKGGNFLAS